MVSRKYSVRCLQKTMRKVGNALKVAQLMQNSLSSRVRQGLSEYNPFLQIQKYQSETAGRPTEQCRMRCQESVDNTWLSTSFTLCASNARCQHRARNHSAPSREHLAVTQHELLAQRGNLIESSSSGISKDVHELTTSACSFHSFGHSGLC